MENLISELGKKFPSLEGLTVADCGCGEGEKTFLLAQKGAIVTAFDKNAKLLSEVKKTAKDLGLKVKTKQALIEEYESEKKFDVVLFMYVLHFVKDKNKALRSVVKLARKGGIVVFSDLEDRGSIGPDYVKYLKEELTNAEERRFEINDRPHAGYPRSHSHKIYILIGTKK